MPATSISFMRSLCAGEIEEGVLFPYPTLADEERETLTAVVDAVDAVLEGHAEDFRSWDVAGEMPTEFIQELREFGLFGLVIPEAQGGMDFGSMAYSRTVQQVARHDASVAVTIGAALPGNARHRVRLMARERNLLSLMPHGTAGRITLLVPWLARDWPLKGEKQ